MAKKKKKKQIEKEEKYEFKYPEFDEKEYLEKELRDTKSLVAAIAFGAATGIAALPVTIYAAPALGFLLGIAAMAGLYYIYPLLNIDTVLFDWKNWAGNFFSFFFTFLAIWVLVSNPPIMDLANPDISGVLILDDFGEKDSPLFHRSYVFLKDDLGNLNETTTVPLGANVTVIAAISDNGGISGYEFEVRDSSGNPVQGEEGTLTREDYDNAVNYDHYVAMSRSEDKKEAKRGEAVVKKYDMEWERFKDDFRTYTFTCSSVGQFTVRIMAWDHSEHTDRTVETEDFLVS